MSKTVFRMPSSIFARTSGLAPFTGYSMDTDCRRESVLQQGVRLSLAQGRGLLVRVGGGPQVAAGHQKKGCRTG